LFTHTAHPEACHIVPFAFNSTTTNLIVYTKRFMNALALLFFPADDRYTCRDLIGVKLGGSDRHWNMLSINPYLHVLWAKPYWAIQCLGIESSSDTMHSVVLAFHWMPRRARERNPDQKICLDAGARDCQDMLDALVGEGSYGEGPVPGMQGFANALQHDCFRPIVSGQEFRVMFDTLDDAIKMRKMVDVQWAIVRLAAMSGAAGPDDLADDFSEFDFEREAYERKQYLDSLDAASDE
ncbi:MAG: hypothetical protein AB7E55_36355, partial [Pigmentiphaga sp.]